jgi:hypothetical protein
MSSPLIHIDRISKDDEAYKYYDMDVRNFIKGDLETSELKNFDPEHPYNHLIENFRRQLVEKQRAALNSAVYSESCD